MNSKRIYYAMIGVLGLLFLAIIGGTYLASQQLHVQSTKLLDYKTQNQVLEQEQAGLAKAKQDVRKYSELETIAKTIVPQDKDQAQVVREIVKIAADSGIKPTAINFPVSTLGMTASGAPSTSSSTSKQSLLSQLKPVKGIAGVYTQQITIQQDSTSPVPYAQFLDFLSRLEQNRRTAQVDGILLQPSTTSKGMVSFTLTVDEFIKP